MSQSGSGQSVSEDSTESQQSGPTASKPKTDFGKKHKKVVRILTVIAYIISVSTAAVLLSTYYVFLWHPEKTDKSTDGTSTTVAMASIYPKYSAQQSQQMSPYKSSLPLGLPQYAQFVDVNNPHHLHSSSKHVAHLKSRKSSSSPYFFSQQQHLTHLLPPTPQSLIMQNILMSSTTPLTPFTHPGPSSTPTPAPTVPSDSFPLQSSTKSPVESTSTFASAFPSLSSSLSSTLSSKSNVVMNIPKTGATPAVSTARTSSHSQSAIILPTNPTNSFTRRLLNSSTLPIQSNPKASTSTITVSTRPSSHSPDSDSGLESTEKIKNVKTTNDHHEEKVLSLRASTPSGRHSFPQRDLGTGNPIIIMN